MPTVTVAAFIPGRLMHLGREIIAK